MKRILAAMAVVLAGGLCVTGYILHAAQTAPASQPVAFKQPPNEPDSKARLEKSPRHGEFVEIKVEGREKPMKAYVVFPERKDKAPVVVVIMEIFGMSDWLRATTDQLAADGFIAICPDVLTGKGAGGADVVGDTARTVINTVPEAEVLACFNAARDYGLKLPSANGKSASVGFCWGGTKSIRFATVQPDLNAAVAFYGSATTADDQIAKIKAPIMGFYGGNDARVTDTVAATAEKMKTAGKKFESHTYAGAGHGFMRQQSAGPNLTAATQAWPLAIKFLQDNTK